MKKPLYSREGANVSITAGGAIVEAPGDYGEEGFIWQAYHELPRFDGNYTVIGSWIVGEEPAGIGIREDDYADHEEFEPLRAALFHRDSKERIAP